MRRRGRRWNRHGGRATRGVSAGSEKTKGVTSGGTLRIQSGDVREAAAQNDDVRIEHVDDARQRACQTAFVDVERPTARSHRRLRRVLRCPPRRRAGQQLPRTSPTDRVRRETSRCSRCARNSTSGRGARPPAATEAGCGPTLPRCDGGLRARGRSPRYLRRCRCRESRRTRCRAPCAAPSVASDSAKQLASLLTRTGPAERARQIAIERMADEPHGVGVLHQPGRWRNRPGNADADGSRCAQLAFDRGDEIAAPREIVAS